jgi:hypothetical protein
MYLTQITSYAPQLTRNSKQTTPFTARPHPDCVSCGLADGVPAEPKQRHQQRAGRQPIHHRLPLRPTRHQREAAAAEAASHGSSRRRLVTQHLPAAAAAGGCFVTDTMEGCRGHCRNWLMSDNNQTLRGCSTCWKNVSVLAGHVCSHGDSIVNSCPGPSGRTTACADRHHKAERESSASYGDELVQDLTS